MSLSRTSAYQHNAATMRQLYAPFSSHFSFPFIVSTYPQSLSLALPRSPLRYKLELTDEAACMYISLPSCRRGGQSFFNPIVFCLSILLTHVLPRPSNRLAELLFARSWLVSHACQHLVNALCSFPFPLSLLLGRHFHLRSSGSGSTYLRYSAELEITMIGRRILQKLGLSLNTVLM